MKETFPHSPKLPESIPENFPLDMYRFPGQEKGIAERWYKKYQEAQEKFILAENISSIRIPKLFISGSEDTITPSQGVQELYSQSQEPKEYIELEDVGHNYYEEPEHVSKLNSKVISWENNRKKLIVIVDADDNVLGFKNRGDILDDIYRVSALWITDEDGNILLAQRALTKKHHPGLFGPAVAGTVEQGETYGYNIQKEAEEELGLEGLDLQEIKTEFHDGTYKHFTRWYKAEIHKDTEMSLQEDEVASVRWFEPQELKRLLEDQPELFLESLEKHFEYFEEFKN
jgi:isopentenyl-diphosphate delta-isomerase